MRTFSKILFFILSSPCLIANADWFDGKLNDYTCPTKNDSVACSKKCTQDNYPPHLYRQTSFKVNVEKSLVLWTLFDNGKAYASGSFRNCKVVDKSNWICDDSIQGIQLDLHAMTNGVYNSQFKIGTAPPSYTCSRN